MTENDARNPLERVAIVGVGAVGSTMAYALLQAGLTHDLVLVDTNLRRAEGELMDLQHCVPFTRPAALSFSDSAGVKDCGLIIVTAGVAQKPGESRLDIAQRNADVFSGLIPALAKNNPQAIFLIVTNPVDVMTRVALKLTGFPAQRVFGSGTVLDTARFRALLSQHCRVQTKHVHAYVVGEHGDSEVLAWSRASVGPFHVAEFGEHHNVPILPEDKERITQEVRSAAARIIERKGSTHFAIGLAVVSLAEGLTQLQDSIYTVSRRCEGLFGLQDVCLSVPTLVNRAGAHTHFEIELSSGEQEAFMKSAEILDKVYTRLRI